MNINRHNYETFFLLYVDNELSAAERNAVELFVQENPDLGIEFHALQETALVEEPVEFNIKNSLYRVQQDAVISEENLLLHLDMELENVTAQKLEASLVADTALLEQWQVLQQTKLDPDDRYVFHDKKVLYRQEKGRVIGFRYWKAAAAVLLLISLYTGISLVKNNNGVATETAAGPAVKQAQDIKPNEALKPGKEPIDNSLGILPHDIAQEKKQHPVNTAKSSKQVSDPAMKNKKDQQNNLVQRNQVLPRPGLENINNDDRNKIASLDVTDKNKEIIIKNKSAVETATITTKEKIVAPSAPVIDYNSIPPMPDSYAKTAVMTEPFTDNDNKILYVSEERIARSKIGGLFRKVKRVIERNTNIKTGNGVTIAGFEIAVK